MTPPKKPWVKMPTGWIADGRLRELVWDQHGSARTSALMLLITAAHFADEMGRVKLTYAHLHALTGISRTLISRGLGILNAMGLLIPDPDERSVFRVMNYGQTPWGKLPAKGLYIQGGQIGLFAHFHLRHPAELWALKLYLLLIALRQNETNLARISYKTIALRAKMSEPSIKKGLNLLLLHGMVHIEHLPRADGTGVFTAYRIPQIDPYRHMGTIGRSGDAAPVRDLENFPS